MEKDLKLLYNISCIFILSYFVLMVIIEPKIDDRLATALFFIPMGLIFLSPILTMVSVKENASIFWVKVNRTKNPIFYWVLVFFYAGIGIAGILNGIYLIYLTMK